MTYLLVASLIAFFTVKIVGIPIGPKMFAKIVLSIVAFLPLYLLVAYVVSSLLSRDLKRLEEKLKELPTLEGTPPTRIREIGKLGDALLTQSERIGSLIESQRLVLYRIAHDLGTPLTNIKNVLQAIRDGIIKEEEADNYLKKAIGETDKAMSIVREALEGLRKVSRSSTIENVDLCPFLGEVVSLWRVRLIKEGKSIELLCPSGVSICVSPTDLKEVLDNLIENAFRHSETDRVFIKVSRERELVRITVSNRGKFGDGEIYRAYRKGSLGLYIVKELVWRNGGDISISVNRNTTEVVLSFPASKFY